VPARLHLGLETLGDKRIRHSAGKQWSDVHSRQICKRVVNNWSSVLMKRAAVWYDRWYCMIWIVSSSRLTPENWAFWLLSESRKPWNPCETAFSEGEACPSVATACW